MCSLQLGLPSFPLPPLCSSSPSPSLSFPFSFFCVVLSAFLDGLGYGGSWGKRRGSLVMRPTFGVSSPCAWKHTYTHKHAHTHAHTRTHKDTHAQAHTMHTHGNKHQGGKTLEKEQGLKREEGGEGGHLGTLSRVNLSALLPLVHLSSRTYSCPLLNIFILFFFIQRRL